MLRAGVDPHRVQRILRHSDVRTTTSVYGHLLVEDLRSAVNSIARPSMLPEPPDMHATKMKIASAATPFAALVLHGPEKRSRGRSDGASFSNRIATLELRARRELNPRPSDSKSDALSS